MLLALAWPAHVHHGIAYAWFEKNSSSGWATCPMTQSAFVRLSANPRFIPEAATLSTAIDLLARILDLKDHVFWPDDIPFDRKHIPCELLIGHKQVADAYLLGLAIRRKGRLVTLDADVAALLPSKSPHRKSLEIVTLR